MRIPACATLLLLGAVVLPAARADAAILVRNDNQKWIQFTVYDLTRNELSRGCVGPRQSRRWAGENYEILGGVFFLRAEVKEGPNCSGNTLHDTAFGPALTVSPNTTLQRTMPPGPAPAFR